MFKCKQCGRGFSANLPEHCPDCGAANRPHDEMTGGRFVNLISIVALGCFAELLLLGIVVGIVIALAIKYL